MIPEWATVRTMPCERELYLWTLRPGTRCTLQIVHVVYSIVDQYSFPLLPSYLMLKSVHPVVLLNESDISPRPVQSPSARWNLFLWLKRRWSHFCVLMFFAPGAIGRNPNEAGSCASPAQSSCALRNVFSFMHSVVHHARLGTCPTRKFLFVIHSVVDMICVWSCLFSFV